MRGLRAVALVASGEPTAFVTVDEGILERDFRVRIVRWAGKRSIPSLAWAVLRTDAVFSWFALDHAYGACRFAKLFGKKSIVVVGGVDAAKVPDLGYGVFLNPPMAARTVYAVTHSDRVLVVEDALREDLVENAGVDRPEISVVLLGFDTALFSPGSGRRDNVLMVAAISEANMKRKALDVYVEVARRMPDVPFVLIGARDNRATEDLAGRAPPNLRILGRLSQAELLDQYRSAKVYVQISRYEAFGSALGEAMACGCIPVGTPVGGIRHLIGDTGFYAPVGDVEGTVAAIRNALRKPDGSDARTRIQREFSLERRAASVLRVVHELIGG